jgi:2-oxo-hept-3-ene-1,7-dioate hydratase
MAGPPRRRDDDARVERIARVSEPDHGTLPDDMLLPGGGEVPAARFGWARLEVEFAFVPARPCRAPA